MRIVAPAARVEGAADEPCEPLGAGATRVVDLTGSIPASATAVTFNLTAVSPTAATFVTASAPKPVERPVEPMRPICSPRVTCSPA